MEEDRHFYIDNANPTEVAYIIKAISSDEKSSRKEIKELVDSVYGFTFQKNSELSFRRAEDLGVCDWEGRIKHYSANKRTLKLQEILSYDQNLAFDILHYFHYTLYNGVDVDRKLLWTYRECCEYIWQSEKKIDVKSTAARLQDQIATEFPHLEKYISDEKGMRIDARGVQEVLKWLNKLVPPPFSDENSSKLQKRKVDDYRLALLAIDHVYRHKKYEYGFPLLLDDKIVDAIAKVFFLDEAVCRELIGVAAKLSDAISLSDTLAGTAVTLHAPYGVENL